MHLLTVDKWMQTEDGRWFRSLRTTYSMPEPQIRKDYMLYRDPQKVEQIEEQTEGQRKRLYEQSKTFCGCPCHDDEKAVCNLLKGHDGDHQDWRGHSGEGISESLYKQWPQTFDDMPKRKNRAFLCKFTG